MLSVSSSRHATVVTSIHQPVTSHFVWEFDSLLLIFSFDCTSVSNLYPPFTSEAHSVKPSISRQWVWVGVGGCEFFRGCIGDSLEDFFASEKYPF